MNSTQIITTEEFKSWLEKTEAYEAYRKFIIEQELSIINNSNSSNNNYYNDDESFEVECAFESRVDTSIRLFNMEYFKYGSPFDVFDTRTLKSGTREEMLINGLRHLFKTRYMELCVTSSNLLTA